MTKLIWEYDQVKAILVKHDCLGKDVEDLDNPKLLEELFEYFQEDMPYGTQKARTGDPDEWILDRLFELKLVGDEEKENDFRTDYAQRKAF